MTDPDYYERLAAAYLKALARADMALKEAARMKRVRLAGYQRPLEQK
jgi:hypothetical protein